MLGENNEVDEYILRLSGIEKQWVEFFVKYMRDNHHDLEEIMSLCKYKRVVLNWIRAY